MAARRKSVNFMVIVLLSGMLMCRREEQDKTYIYVRIIQCLMLGNQGRLDLGTVLHVLVVASYTLMVCASQIYTSIRLAEKPYFR